MYWDYRFKTCYTASLCWLQIFVTVLLKIALEFNLQSVDIYVYCQDIVEICLLVSILGLEHCLWSTGIYCTVFFPMRGYIFVALVTNVWRRWPLYIIVLISGIICMYLPFICCKNISMYGRSDLVGFHFNIPGHGTLHLIYLQNQ